jgi:acyl-[acyl-carrier-protein]-phospholipid O-acyltransferase/long-chain-fatty-acid--[acyl-carrier-protein] ligase
MSTPSRLSRSFSALNATQFFGALNDNVFKLLATFVVIGAVGQAEAQKMSGIGGLLFALPFLLFTPAAGVLADRISKRSIIVLAKVLEIGVMALGVAAFAVGKPWLAFGVLFLMSAQSALFGPAKYGIIPELVTKDQLSRANSYIVMMTYLAVIIGTGLGPWLAEQVGGRYAVAAVACVVLAVAGTAASLGIGKTPPARATATASLFFVKDVWKTMRSIRHDRYLVMTVVAAAYFSLIGAFLQLNLIPFGIRHLGVSEVQGGYLFLPAALGIGMGAFVAGKLSGRNVEFGIVPMGAFGLTVCVFGLAVLPHGIATTLALVALAGFSAGLYIVPLEAFIQLRSPPDRRGEIIAANGFLSWIGVLLAAVFMLVFDALGLSPALGFFVMSVLTLGLTVAALRVLPDFLVRFIGLVLTRLCYRIRVLGLENVPIEGGALLVSNHVSMSDALLIQATQQRRIRFMMYRSIYEQHPLKAIFKLMRVIPIAMEDTPKKLLESLHLARQELDDGYLVCIFAEGALTRTGNMQEFKSGLERIVKGTSHPIVPVYLGGVWGSIFSHYYGPKRPSVPVRFPYPATVIFGKPLPPTSKSHEVRGAVLELSVDYMNDRKPEREPLGVCFARTARKNWSRDAMSDTTGKRLSFGRALAGSVALAAVLRKEVDGQDHVGVLVPTSVGGALTNLALAMLRKVSVNLNFTASKEAFASAIKQAEIRTIITSKAFIEKMPQFAEIPGLLYLEDLSARIAPSSKVLALMKARFLPVGMLCSARHFEADELATIIFSSGTTGEPKGVMLSHHNLISNVESLTLVFRPKPEDRLYGALPFFHSFGFLAGIWFPMLTGTPCSYHTNPLDGAKAAEVVRQDRCTALFATPTFLLSYIRRAEKEDFKTLRMVVVGAEKLKPKVAEAFEEKFGFRPLEGFGATELAPVAALSIPDVDVDGVYQAGTRIGSVGQAMPGVAAKVVDPESGAMLAPGHPGLLLIKGPNVMLGYLKRPDLTAEAIQDGWYHTGDIATIDDDGFITITDRLARFSKIGGEMVPHMAIEDAYIKGLQTHEHVLAVTSMPDEKRGERLVVLYTEAAGDPAALHAIIEKSEIPNLWKPDRNAYFKVDHIPVTGSGKLDVKSIKHLAADAAKP